MNQGHGFESFFFGVAIVRICSTDSATLWVPSAIETSVDPSGFETIIPPSIRNSEWA